MKLLFSVIPCLSLRLSNGSFTNTLVLLCRLYYFALTRKIFGTKKDFTLNVTYNNHPITFLLRYVVDIAVLREVFVDSEYDWFPSRNPKVILDLGAHFGDTSLYYHARFPEAKIIAVEPSPENYLRLVQHTRNITNIIPVEVAVGGIDGEISLNISGVQFGHSVMDRGSLSEKVVVPQVTLDTLFKKYSLPQADLIKFDIEGAEFALFKDLEPKKYSKAYIGEIHLDMSNGATLDEFNNNFAGFNLNTIKLSENKRYILTAFSD